MPSSSLLDVALERLTDAGRELEPLMRVSLIGRLAAGSSADAFGKWCAEHCKQPAQLTGLLMMLPNGWVQTIEGPGADVVPYLHAMRAQMSGSGMLAKAVVIAAQEDIRGRYFPSWAYKSASAQRSNYAEVETEAQLAAVVSDLAIGMLKIGKKLKEGKDVSILDSWESHFSDSMPSNERVDQLLDLSELPQLDGFLELYEIPVDMTMESDRVWPPERPQPY